MASVTIRNLDDETVEKLKERAKSNHRSLAAEIRHILTREVDHRLRMAEFRERTRQIAAMTPNVPQTDSVELLREDRDR
jgi:plasmid stability protein